MATAEALVKHLKDSGTGENKLKPVREFIAANPKATADDAFDVLSRHVGPLAVGEPKPGHRERPVSPGTLAKAQEFLEAHQPKDDAGKSPDANRQKPGKQ